MSKVTRYYGNDLFIEGSAPKRPPVRPMKVKRPRLQRGAKDLNPCCVPVIMVNAFGSELRWFPSISAAAIYAGVRQATMSQWIRDKVERQGCYWEKE